MPDSPSQLPPEVTARVASRLHRLSPEMFRVLDEIREFGGNCLAVRLAHPDTAEEMQLVLAPLNFQVEISGTARPSHAPHS